MKIYTKTGDTGQTGLFGGPRVWKDDSRIEACGAVDELNAQLGVARAAQLPAELDSVLELVQNGLFALGAELATPDAAARGQCRLQPAHIEVLEAEIDRLEAGLPALQNFILPGGASHAAILHLARGICRRAERRVVAVGRQQADPAEDAARQAVLIGYLNRLSDLLFVMARTANHLAGRPDDPWVPE